MGIASIGTFVAGEMLRHRMALMRGQRGQSGDEDPPPAPRQGPQEDPFDEIPPLEL